MFPESYWEPLLVVANISAEVEENTEYTLDPSEFHVMHPTIAPEDIVYTVKHGPLHGKLEVDVPKEQDFNLITSLEFDDYTFNDFDDTPFTNNKHRVRKKF